MNTTCLRPHNMTIQWVEEQTAPVLFWVALKELKFSYYSTKTSQTKRVASENQLSLIEFINSGAALAGSWNSLCMNGRDLLKKLEHTAIVSGSWNVS